MKFGGGEVRRETGIVQEGANTSKMQKHGREKGVKESNK